MAVNMTSETKRGLSDRNKLVMEHMYLVKFVVNRMTMNLPPGISKDDLFSIGSWGLIDAAEKFNEEKGVMFKTYAMTRIRGAILDELRRLSLGGQSLCRKTKNLEKAIRAVELNTGRAATDEEIAKELKISETALQTLYAEVSRSFLVSLDEFTYDEEEGESFVDTLEDRNTPSPELQFDQQEVKDQLMGHLDDIPEQERKVLVLYYYEELTLKEIGMILDVSESRVSQIHTKAILRLRGRLSLSTSVKE